MIADVGLGVNVEETEAVGLMVMVEVVIGTSEVGSGGGDRVLERVLKQGICASKGVVHNR
jgi:hypothetical protein